jgi:hypothetical protein
MIFHDAIHTFLAPLSAGTVLTDGANDYTTADLQGLVDDRGTDNQGQWEVRGSAMYRVGEDGQVAAFPTYRVKE